MIPFEANFDDIYSIYFESTGAGRALGFVSSCVDGAGFFDAPPNSPVLVAAGTGGGWQKGNDLESAVAEMISGFSILELAAMTGFISMVSFSSNSSVAVPFVLARQDFIRHAKKVLESDAVRKISENNSPFPVAQLFWLRICGNRGHSEECLGKEFLVEFLDLLRIDEYYNNSLRDGVFLKLAQGAKFDGYKLLDLQKMIVDSPFSFSAQLLEETAGHDSLSKACGELIRFLSFLQ